MLGVSLIFAAKTAGGYGQAIDGIIDIAAPTPGAPSMTMAIEQYVKQVNK